MSEIDHGPGNRPDWQRLAAEAVLKELSGRSGIGDALDDVDDDTRDEIVEALEKIIVAAAPGTTA